MLESYPPRSPGSAIGYLLMAGLVLLDVCLLVLLLNEPVSGLSVVWGGLIAASFPALAFIGFWASSLAKARYQVVDGQWLVIEWAGLRQVIPLSDIEFVRPGDVSRPVSNFRGVRWPGYQLGVGQLSDLKRPVWIFATRPEKNQLFIITQRTAYAISPIDRDLFQHSLEAFVAAPRPDEDGHEIGQLGSLEDGEPLATQWGFLGWALWQDRLMQSMMVIAAGLCGSLFFYVAFNYGRLPAQMPLHFNQQGQADRFGSPAGLFIPPLVGLVSLLINWLVGGYAYGRQDDRPVAFLLWGTSVVIQLAAWVAIANLLA